LTEKAITGTAAYSVNGLVDLPGSGVVVTD